ncbi:hypothetical protein BAE46_06525 [Glaciecola punicea]|nr:hypothetical protein BAE46_06525 [Glaciecola punicea]
MWYKQDWYLNFSRITYPAHFDYAVTIIGHKQDYYQNLNGVNAKLLTPSSSNCYVQCKDSFLCGTKLIQIKY